MPRRDSPLLEDALAALVRALVDTGAPWMILGGIAVIAHGVRRFTTDVDAAVRGDAVEVDALLEALARRKIAPRIDDARAFAEANLVLLLRHAPTGVDLDVSLAWSAFEHEALAAATEVAFGRVVAQMPTPADLVILKAVAGRAKDMEDAETLLVLHPDIDLARVRARVAELAELAEAPELLDGFEKTAARARGEAKRRTKPARPKPSRRRPR
jgi:predicted nucleotidyltransferase